MEVAVKFDRKLEGKRKKKLHLIRLSIVYLVIIIIICRFIIIFGIFRLDSDIQIRKEKSMHVAFTFIRSTSDILDDGFFFIPSTQLHYRRLILQLILLHVSIVRPYIIS
jgi:hypothetical protein